MKIKLFISIILICFSVNLFPIKLRVYKFLKEKALGEIEVKNDELIANILKSIEEKFRIKNLSCLFFLKAENYNPDKSSEIILVKNLETLEFIINKHNLGGYKIISVIIDYSLK